MSDETRRVVLITGPSGAGLSTATGALEDAGFEAIDNLPLRLVRPLLEQPEKSGRPLSLGLDMRNRDFSVDGLTGLIAALRAREDIALQVLFLTCRSEQIQRRYSSTKRRHPIGEAPTLQDAIAYEIELLEPLRTGADVLIDTSELNPHELRAEVERWFAPDGRHRTMVQVQSFSYKRGLPRNVDIVFDCRFLQNPHWQADLRPRDGRDGAVQSYVTADPRFEPFFDKITDLCQFLLPAVQEEGKSYLTIAFGCTGGRHRSVTLAERLTDALEVSGWQVSTRHRELDRQARHEAPQ